LVLYTNPREESKILNKKKNREQNRRTPLFTFGPKNTFPSAKY
jgi:hypothetical protein